MGFQDNSGDIIFDVILTDEGRKQLAEGSFKVSQFKLADDEINYALFDNTTGSAYQDLQILQTPVFEAFSNNTSNMSSLLVSYTSNTHLYLPVIKLNNISSELTKMHALATFMVCCTQETEGTDNSTAGKYLPYPNAVRADGFIYGVTPTHTNSSMIRVDSGIDNAAEPPTLGPPSQTDGLFEGDYYVEIDNRLGTICDPNGNDAAPLDVDDDNIALYLLEDGVFGGISVNQNTDIDTQSEVIRGRRATSLSFKIRAQSALGQSDFYFTKFGGTTTMTNYANGSQNVRYIDSLIKVTGVTTGYTIDIPVRYVKVY